MNSKIQDFNLEGQDIYSDEYAISIAIDCAKLFLRNSKISTRQIIGLGNALYALERMPASTPVLLLSSELPTGLTATTQNQKCAI